MFRFRPAVPASTSTVPRTVRLAPGASVPRRQKALPRKMLARLRVWRPASLTAAGGTSTTSTLIAATGPVLVTVSLNGTRRPTRVTRGADFTIRSWVERGGVGGAGGLSGVGGV